MRDVNSKTIFKELGFQFRSGNDYLAVMRGGELKQITEQDEMKVAVRLIGTIEEPTFVLQHRPIDQQR